MIEKEPDIMEIMKSYTMVFTAKAKDIRQYLFDVCDPDERYNATFYERSENKPYIGKKKSFMVREVSTKKEYPLEYVYRITTTGVLWDQHHGTPFISYRGSKWLDGFGKAAFDNRFDPTHPPKCSWDDLKKADHVRITLRDKNGTVFTERGTILILAKETYGDRL